MDLERLQARLRDAERVASRERARSQALELQTNADMAAAAASAEVASGRILDLEAEAAVVSVRMSELGAEVDTASIRIACLEAEAARLSAGLKVASRTAAEGESKAAELNEVLLELRREDQEKMAREGILGAAAAAALKEAVEERGALIESTVRLGNELAAATSELREAKEEIERYKALAAAAEAHLPPAGDDAHCSDPLMEGSSHQMLLSQLQAVLDRGLLSGGRGGQALREPVVVMDAAIQAAADIMIVHPMAHVAIQTMCPALQEAAVQTSALSAGSDTAAQTDPATFPMALVVQEREQGLRNTIAALETQLPSSRSHMSLLEGNPLEGQAKMENNADPALGTEESLEGDSMNGSRQHLVIHVDLLQQRLADAQQERGRLIRCIDASTAALEQSRAEAIRLVSELGKEQAERSAAEDELRQSLGRLARDRDAAVADLASLRLDLSAAFHARDEAASMVGRLQLVVSEAEAGAEKIRLPLIEEQTGRSKGDVQVQTDQAGQWKAGTASRSADVACQTACHDICEGTPSPSGSVALAKKAGRQQQAQKLKDHLERLNSQVSEHRAAAAAEEVRLRGALMRAQTATTAAEAAERHLDRLNQRVVAARAAGGREVEEARASVGALSREFAAAAESFAETKATMASEIEELHDIRVREE